MSTPYHTAGRDWDRWIHSQRGSTMRAELDPARPHAFHLEDERSSNGEIVPVATIFLTNKECPWKCLMCDLWKNTLKEAVPEGAIPRQIDYALAHLPPARQIKLYNSGSFFDRRAIPINDYGPISERIRSFERIIVESHPALIGKDCMRFKDMVNGRLEVAMGLETVDPEVLPRLNKGMTLDQFADAAQRLRRNGIPLRVFILVKPPFMGEEEALHWANRSVDFAFECGADAVALIPTRRGNGALEVLEQNGDFAPPRLSTLEAAAAYGIGLGKGRVFADLWDLEQFAACPQCFPLRQNRLSRMNLEQAVPPSFSCGLCGELVGSRMSPGELSA